MNQPIIILKFVAGGNTNCDKTFNLSKCIYEQQPEVGGRLTNIIKTLFIAFITVTPNNAPLASSHISTT